jgi:hypothetical protein
LAESPAYAVPATKPEVATETSRIWCIRM